jgi:hypothetical protein
MSIKSFADYLFGKARRSAPFRFDLLLSIAAAGLVGCIGVYIDHFPSVNDLFDNHYLSMVMSFSDIHSWYDGFFPFGYSLLLKLLTGGDFPAVAAYHVNVLLTFAMMLAIAWYLRKKDLRRLFPVWLCCFILFPRTFRYQITPGPDTAAMALFTVGAVLLLSRLNPSEKATPSKSAVLLSAAAGISMGIGALFRYHILVASFLFLAAFFLSAKNGRKCAVISGISLGVCYLPQILVNVFTGHGPLETYHSLNLYNLVYGVNWYHVDKLLPLPTPKSIILGAPFVCIKHYLAGTLGLLVFALPPAMYALLSPAGRTSGFCVALFCAAYALFFGTSASPRAALPLIPVSMLFFVRILFALHPQKRVKLAMVALLLACGCLFLMLDVKKIRSFKAERERYGNMETFFIKSGVKNGHEIYSCDLNQYFATLSPHVPLFNGGWGRVATYRYNELIPELDVGSLEGFYADCVRRKVRFVVLNGNASKLADFCGDLYTGKIKDSRFMAAASFGGNKIFGVIQ